MTEKQKRFAIIAGTVIAAVLLFLWLRRGGTAGNTVVQNAPFDLPAVGLGPIYLPDDPGATYDIPGLDLSGPDLSMIGACCSDCMQSSSQFFQPQYDTAGNTYVFNEGDSGPNIYNIGGLVDSRNDGINGNKAQVLAETGSYFYNPAYGY